MSALIAIMIQEVRGVHLATRRALDAQVVLPQAVPPATEMHSELSLQVPVYARQAIMPLLLLLNSAQLAIPHA